MTSPPALRTAADLAELQDRQWPQPLTPITGRAAIVITDLPQVVTLALYAGDDFVLQVNVADPDTGQPLDLTGAEPLAQIRATPEADEIAGQFEATIDGSTVYLHLTSAVSAGLPRRSVWDVQITLDQRVRTLAAGTIDLTPQVSR
jgi:hypothetical protein